MVQCNTPAPAVNIPAVETVSPEVAALQGRARARLAGQSTRTKRTYGPNGEITDTVVRREEMIDCQTGRHYTEEIEVSRVEELARLRAKRAIASAVMHGATEDADSLMTARQAVDVALVALREIARVVGDTQIALRVSYAEIERRETRARRRREAAETDYGCADEEIERHDGLVVERDPWLCHDDPDLGEAREEIATLLAHVAELEPPAGWRLLAAPEVGTRVRLPDSEIVEVVRVEGDDVDVRRVDGKVELVTLGECTPAEVHS